MDTHEPYAPPKPWLPKEFKDRNEARIFNHILRNKEEAKKYVNLLKRLYEGEVRYLDFLLGKFFEFLEEKNIMEQSLIIFTSDHGDAFLEHGVLQHPSHNLYNEIVHVPLILFDGESSGIIHQPVSHIDISPTILNFLGIKIPRNFYGKPISMYKESKKIIYIDGIDIDFNNWVYKTRKPYVAVIDYPWKLIYCPDGHKELYNLAKDSAEKNNLVSEEPDITYELSIMVKRHIIECKIVRRLFNNMKCIKK